MRMFRTSIFTLAMAAIWTVAARPAEEEKHLIAKEDAVQVILLRQKAVQKDLNISEDEAKKIHAFGAKQGKKVKDMKGLSAEERNRKFAAMAKENEKFLKDTLTAEQHKRLNQITMQIVGLMWVLRPHVATELKLTDDQKQKIKDLHKEAEHEAREALRSGGGEIKPEKHKELHKANHDRLQSILTAEQKQQWKEMIGKPFHKEELHFDRIKD